MEGIRRALVLGLVLIAGTAKEQAHFVVTLNNTWSIVIKPADKSSNTSIAPLPLSIVVRISLYTLKKQSQSQNS